MIDQLAHIIWYKLISTFKRKLDLRWNVFLKNLGSVIIFGGFAVGAFLFTKEITAYLLEEARIGLFLFHRFLSMGLFVFFITVTLGNVLVSYSTLFKSPEVNFLMTKPVPFTNVFLIKFLDNFFYSSTIFLLIGFSIIAGYGTYFSQPWYFYPTVLFGIFFPFMFLAASIAVTILLIVVRLADYINVKKLALVFIVGYVGLIFIFFDSVSPIQLVNNVLDHFPEVDKYYSDYDPWFMTFLPSHWVAEFLYWTASGDIQIAFAYAYLLLVSVALFLIFALIIGWKYYYRSFLVSLKLKEKSRSKPKPVLTKLIGFDRIHLLPDHLSVILKRDFIRFFRDPGQWIHLSLMTILVFVFMFSIGSIEFEQGNPFLMMAIFLVVFLFNSFLIAAMTLRFVYPLVSLEGEALWAVRSSPIHMYLLYLTRGIAPAVGILFLAVFLSFITMKSLFGNTDLVVFSVGGQFLTALTLISLNLGLGSYFAEYKEKNPIRIASSQGASLTFLTAILYLVVIITYYSPFLNMYFEKIYFNSAAGWSWMILPLVIGSVLSFIIITFTTILGLRALQRDV